MRKATFFLLVFSLFMVVPLVLEAQTDDVSVLQSDIKKLRKQIEILNGNIKKLEKEVDVTTGIPSQVPIPTIDQQELQNLHEKLQTVQEERKRFKGDLRKKNQQIVELKDDLNKKFAQIEDLTLLLNRLRADVDLLDGDNARLRREVKEAGENINSVTAYLDDLSEELRLAEMKNRELEKRLITLNKQNGQLEDTIDDKDKEIAQAEDRYQEAGNRYFRSWRSVYAGVNFALTDPPVLQLTGVSKVTSRLGTFITLGPVGVFFNGHSKVNMPTPSKEFRYTFQRIISTQNQLAANNEPFQALRQVGSGGNLTTYNIGAYLNVVRGPFYLTAGLTRISGEWWGIYEGDLGASSNVKPNAQTGQYIVDYQGFDRNWYPILGGAFVFHHQGRIPVTLNIEGGYLFAFDRYYLNAGLSFRLKDDISVSQIEQLFE